MTTITKILSKKNTYEVLNRERNTYYTSQCLESLENYSLILKSDIHLVGQSLVKFAKKLQPLGQKNQTLLMSLSSLIKGESKQLLLQKYL